VEQGARYESNAGRVEQELRDIASEVTVMAMSVLAMRGMLVSDRERTEFQRKIYGHVSQSVEIEAKLVELMGRIPAA
jgi:hypothetical protein